ncbi:hypothetical protein BDB01DRAFT_793730 [Pilobolus umbonatus]|nr:hypothetical protein BDB01DRAFT_793730 [Pilobolus umbonatus]
MGKSKESKSSGKNTSLSLSAMTFPPGNEQSEPPFESKDAAHLIDRINTRSSRFCFTFLRYLRSLFISFCVVHCVGSLLSRVEIVRMKPPVPKTISPPPPPKIVSTASDIPLFTAEMNHRADFTLSWEDNIPSFVSKIQPTQYPTTTTSSGLDLDKADTTPTIDPDYVSVTSVLLDSSFCSYINSTCNSTTIKRNGPTLSTSAYPFMCDLSSNMLYEQSTCSRPSSATQSTQPLSNSKLTGSTVQSDRPTNHISNPVEKEFNTKSLQVRTEECTSACIKKPSNEFVHSPAKATQSITFRGVHYPISEKNVNRGMPVLVMAVVVLLRITLAVFNRVFF